MARTDERLGEGNKIRFVVNCFARVVYTNAKQIIHVVDRTRKAAKSEKMKSARKMKK